MQHPQTLPTPQRQHLAALCRRHSTAYVARELGQGRDVLARLVAGLPCRPGSVALALANLPRLDAALDSGPQPSAA